MFGFAEAPRLDLFLLFDDFRSDTPEHYRKGFPWHPHRGIETITYLTKREVDHGDSLWLLNNGAWSGQYGAGARSQIEQVRACQSAFNIDYFQRPKMSPLTKKSRFLFEPEGLVSCFSDIAVMGQPI